MIRSITIKANNIEGTAATYYDGKTSLEELFFQRVFGASFSGTGITYVIEKNINSITISSDDLTYSLVLTDLQLFLDAANPLSYPGSGNLWTDVSGNELVAVLTNGPIYSTDGGGSILFDGTNDYVDTNALLSFENFSVGAWFKTTASGVRMILSKETEDGNPWNYRIWLNNGRLYADIAQGAVQSSLFSPLSNYNNGQWWMVFFTRNDDTWDLWVNGVKVATKSDNLTGSIQNDQEVWIGGSIFLGGSYQFSGRIAKILIYSRKLDETEILQNYLATKDDFI